MKNEKGVISMILLIIIAIIIIGATGVLVFGPNPDVTTDKEGHLVLEEDQKKEKHFVLKAGKYYTVNEVKEDQEGVSNKDCGIKLLKDGNFEIFMGYDRTHSGTYKIEGDTIIAHSNKLAWNEGKPGAIKTDVVFTFDVLDSNKLELTEIVINDVTKEPTQLVYNDGLDVGMTYSVK